MKTVRLCLPATSANLGPGFDALALALELFLEIDAVPASDFSIEAEGRDPEICSSLENNLLLETYHSVLAAGQRQGTPLRIRMRNGIPLGMGCGSSAAVRLAGVALATHFGDLAWSRDQIVAAAARLEGHPDNVAACWHGGLTIAAGGAQPTSLSIAPPPGWRAILALPKTSVSTAKSRSVLPASYSREQAVANVQNAALLTAAFAAGRADLLARATQDCLHQPYRMELCPLLPALLPLAGRYGIASVTLSGAGPSVLILGAEDLVEAKPRILASAQRVGPVELLEARISSGGAQMTLDDGLS